VARPFERRQGRLQLRRCLKELLLKLIELLEKAGHSYNGIGLYEYAEGLDAALAEYRKRSGVDEVE
jgi:hypothetical protein